MVIGLNLLYVLPGRVGGTETYAAGLLHGFAGIAGSDQFFVYVSREAADWPLPAGPRFRRVICPVDASFRVARYRYEQTQLPARLGADGVHLLHSLGYVAPLRLPCPSVVTVHDVHHRAYGSPWSWPRRMLLEFFVSQSVRRAAAVIAVSRFSRDEIAQAYGVAARQIDVVLEAPKPRSEALALPAGPSPLVRRGVGGRYLLAFGGLQPNKNLPRLVQAFRTARRQSGLEQELVIVGRLPAGLRLRRGDGVVTTGYLDDADVAAALRCADALVFSSTYEGFGLPVLEAMAAGVPVACSNVTAMPEVAGDAALYFDPESVDDMTRKIGDISLNESLRMELRAKGLARAADFTWEKSARETMAIYRRVLDTTSSRKRHPISV